MARQLGNDLPVRADGERDVHEVSLREGRWPVDVDRAQREADGCGRNSWRTGTREQ